MEHIIKQIKELQKTGIKKQIDNRLNEFLAFKDKPSKEWFSELCFCILTANSKAHTAINIQKELSAEGFCHACSDNIKRCIINNKHRFHNNKTKFIMQAREHIDIKEKIQSIVKEKRQIEARLWLVKNIKGIGFKEASHFLRNVGYFDLAILDRHILNLMVDGKLIKQKPKTLTKNIYLDLEQKFIDIAKTLGMTAAKLDMYMWYIKTGAVLK